jgi:hypothetical protein
MKVLVTAPNIPSKVLNTGSAVAMPNATATIAMFCNTKRVYVSSCSFNTHENFDEAKEVSLARLYLLGEKQAVH